MQDRNSGSFIDGRRRFIRTGLGVAGGLALPAGFVSKALAADQPAIGTYPAGASGNSVFVGASVPRTGTYAVQGEDELKGYQLAVEHINEGNELLKKISPKTTKGVLGKEVKLGVADSAAKPNEAVQAQQRFITENKAVMITGWTSSAVAVALNKLAQREKVLFVCGISGSNDTTGKDCVRYGFRQNFFGQTAAAAIAPVLIKEFGKNKKAAYMTPDYTYGHTVTKSVNDYLTKNGGWTMVTNQVSPLGAPDFSSYLTNIANSGADVLINVNWGHDAVLSIQQAKQFGVLDKMKLVVPYQVPFLARETGGLMQGVYAATDYWWTIEDKYPLAKMFVEAFEKKFGYKPEWGAENAYMEFALWAEAVENAGTFYPPDVIKSYEEAAQAPVDGGRGALARRRPPARPPGGHRQGQGAQGHEEQGGLLGGRRGRARRAADAEAGRVRLQSRRLHLSPGLLTARPARQPAGVCRLAPFVAAMITWPNFVSQLFNGLVLGALLALISSGLTIIYGTLGVLNLAHGAMFMLGGYAGYVAYQATGSFVVAVIAGTLFMLVVGVVMERVIIRHFYGRPHEDQLLVTFGLSIVFVEIVRFFFSSQSKTVPPPGSVRHHPARLHVLPDLPSRGRRHCRGRAWRVVRRSLPHPVGHDRARRHRRFRDGGFARHQRLPRLHDRVRHRRDGGGLCRHRQRAGGLAHARHGRGDPGADLRRRRDRRRRLVSRRGSRRPDRRRDHQHHLDVQPRLRLRHAVRGDDAGAGGTPAWPAWYAGARMNVVV